MTWQGDDDISAREKAARRLATLAGVDENGGILPPTAEDLAAGIDRRPNSRWRNRK